MLKAKSKHQHDHTITEVVFIRDSHSRFRVYRYRDNGTKRRLLAFIEVGGIGVVDNLSTNDIQRLARREDDNVKRIVLLDVAIENKKDRTGRDILMFLKEYKKKSRFQESRIDLDNVTGRIVREEIRDKEGRLVMLVTRECWSGDGNQSEDENQPKQLIIHLKNNEISLFPSYLRYLKLKRRDAQVILSEVIESRQ